MMLTEQGDYRRDMQRVLNAMQEAERRLNPAEPQFQGRVHVQLPSGLGSLLLPHLLALQKQYPELHLMLSLDDRIADLVTEGWMWRCVSAMSRRHPMLRGFWRGLKRRSLRHQVITPSSPWTTWRSIHTFGLAASRLMLRCG
jgi:hypothetical protein